MCVADSPAACHPSGVTRGFGNDKLDGEKVSVVVDLTFGFIFIVFLIKAVLY